MLRRSLLRSAARAVQQSRPHGVRALSATPSRAAEVELTVGEYSQNVLSESLLTGGRWQKGFNRGYDASGSAVSRVK